MTLTASQLYAPGLGSVTEVTAPTAEPVTVADLKLALRVDDDDENELIANCGIAAREWCENYTRRQFVTATYDWRLDTLPSSSTGALWVPRPKLQSVTSITYTDTAAASQTWASSNYQVDIYDEPGRIIPAYGVTWPSTRDVCNAITIRFVCGYGAPLAVPETVKSAIKLLANHLYEQRDPVVVGTISKELEFSLKALLASVAIRKAA